jgi:hypothetical protein
LPSGSLNPKAAHPNATRSPTFDNVLSFPDRIRTGEKHQKAAVGVEGSQAIFGASYIMNRYIDTTES